MRKKKKAKGQQNSREMETVRELYGMWVMKHLLAGLFTLPVSDPCVTLRKQNWSQTTARAS